MNATPCPGCGEHPGRGRIFCTLCWNDVPTKVRAAVERTSKALGKSPTRAAQMAFELAVADAAGHVR